MKLHTSILAMSSGATDEVQPMLKQRLSERYQENLQALPNVKGTV